MRFNPFDAVTTVNILRRNYQIQRLWRTVFGRNRTPDRADVLRTIESAGLKAAKAGQLGYVQDGSSLPQVFYREMWRTAAEEIGAKFSAVEGTIWEVAYQGRRTRLNLHQTELDNPVALSVAGDKALCHRILAAGGLPVPDHLQFSPYEISAAHRFVERHGGYFVVKPAVGTSAARGITTFVGTLNECTRAAAMASTYNRRILIERVVPGELYRLLVLRGKVIHAIRRPGVRTRGDGASTIAQLAARTLRELSASSRQPSDLDLGKDRDFLANLHAQNLDASSVPEEGREWIVKSYASRMDRKVEENPSYTEDVTDLIGDELKGIAERAAALIRSEFAGVELITPNTAKPLQMNGGRIIEINTTPGLGPHFDLAMAAGAANPATAVLRCLLGLD
jgi:cyanophycin synthetase